jgi:hypothetical protein
MPPNCECEARATPRTSAILTWLPLDAAPCEHAVTECNWKVNVAVAETDFTANRGVSGGSRGSAAESTYLNGRH